jgi:CheY-like chemotaxis protein
MADLISKFDNNVQGLTNFVRERAAPERNSIPRLMIVESYGSNVISLTGHLAGLPIPLEIVAVRDAETAMACIQRENPDLLVIDACLRGRIDGYELCRLLRSSPQNQHLAIILLLSGYLSLERSKGIAVGADLLLLRPIVKEELLKMIRLLLGLKSEQCGNSQLRPESAPLRRLRSVG